MSISRAQFENINENDLLDLINANVPEGALIEYKRDMYGNADADKREFLKDISSFANSSGGHLLIGMDENQGVATAIVPNTDDADQILQRLENLVRSGLEPRVFGIQMKAVAIGGGGNVFVCRIPKSWNPPHRVSSQNSNRFFVRSSAGAHEASVEELRSIFSGGARLRERVEAFRAERVARILANDGIVPLANDPTSKIILHVAPLSAFDGSNAVDLAQANENRHLLPPMGETAFAGRINFDGFVNLRSGDQCFGYTQLFRNGIIEATKVRLVATEGPRRIPTRSFGEFVFQRVPSYLDALTNLGATPPALLMLTLSGLRGAVLGIGNGQVFLEEQTPFDRDTIELPPVQVDEFGDRVAVKQALGPAIDVLWNACGLLSSNEYMACFDENGRWIAPG
ncbi:MAG: ATP-binding protein [Nitratireductor sp.]|nr:ATP-binding protein [Nitratireductor sp.]